MKNYLCFLFMLVCIAGKLTNHTYAQQTTSPNLYRPAETRIPDSAKKISKKDTFQFYRLDTSQVTINFTDDSLKKRQEFIRDSIMRQRRIDSLNFLLAELPLLIDASIKTFTDFIPLNLSTLKLQGDTTLNTVYYDLLPFSLDQPYIPWRLDFNFDNQAILITIDTIKQKIVKITSPHFKHNYIYGNNNSVLEIRHRNIVLKRRTGDLYKEPVDSVFFNTNGNIAKIKRYHKFYTLNGNKKGNLYLVHLYQVKQYTYSNNNTLKTYEIVRFNDRWKPYDPQKVGSIFNYIIEKQGLKYIVDRSQRPANDFADGVFTYEYESAGKLKLLSFKNNKNTENWKTYIETNNEGFATRYIFENKGTVSRTMLIKYYHNTPGASNKVETITCSFDKDGISYYQHNNTTHKTRTRDRMTLEWSDWR